MVRKARLHFLESYYINCENYWLLLLFPQARKVLWILSFFYSQGKPSAPSTIWKRKIIATVPVTQIPHLGLWQTLALLLKTWRVSELETTRGCEPQVRWGSLTERRSAQIHASEILSASNRNWLRHKPNSFGDLDISAWAGMGPRVHPLAPSQPTVDRVINLHEQPHEWTNLLYLFRQADHQVMLRLSNQRLPEVFTACGQHSPVGPELFPLHDQSHVTENILFPLVIETQQDVGAVDCGLIHIHGGVRLLIHRHAVHTLKERKAGSPELPESDTEGEKHAPVPVSHGHEPDKKENCPLA